MRRLGTLAGLPVLAVVLALAAVAAGAVPPTGGQVAPGVVPAAYQPAIEAAAASCPVLSPALLAAQLYQESGWNPRAVSPAGAQGLAQFMPATWTAYGIDATHTGHPNPFNPTDAIYSAASYDCQLAAAVRSVPGSPVANMLAAYNAGPYAVLAAGGIPLIRQTRTYVARIHQLEAAFTATPGSPVPASPAAARVVAFAYTHLGTAYQWGGTGTDGAFDCSGLTQAAYAAAGISLPRTAAQQWYTGRHIPRSQLRPGDLVFYATDLTNPTTIDHVGIYLANGQMIDAPHPGAVVRFDPVGQPNYLGAVRPVAGTR